MLRQSDNKITALYCRLSAILSKYAKENHFSNTTFFVEM